MSIVVFIMIMVYRAMILAMFIYMLYEVIKLLRQKALDDQVIQLFALALAGVIFTWVTSWAQIEAAVVVIALCAWHAVSLRKAGRREAAKEAAQLMEMTMEHGSERAKGNQRRGRGECLAQPMRQGEGALRHDQGCRRNWQARRIAKARRTIRRIWRMCRVRGGSAVYVVIACLA